MDMNIIKGALEELAADYAAGLSTHEYMTVRCERSDTINGGYQRLMRWRMTQDLPMTLFRSLTYFLRHLQILSKQHSVICVKTL